MQYTKVSTPKISGSTVSGATLFAAARPGDVVDVNRIGAQHRDRAVAAAVANRSTGVSKVVAKVAAQCALLGPSWSGRAENTVSAVRVACVHPSGAAWLWALSRSNFTRGRLDMSEVSYRIGLVLFK